MVVKAIYEDKVIAACIFFHFNQNAIYKYGASDLRFQSLRANNLIFYEALCWYSEKGYKEFCFGKTTLDKSRAKTL